MKPNIDSDKIQAYFNEKFLEFGTNPRGADWNSSQAQEIRFDQLLKIIPQPHDYFSLLDFGCGFGALLPYLKKTYSCEYYGFDILETAITSAYETFRQLPNCHFISKIDTVPAVDYVVSSGVFNIKHNYTHSKWTDYVLENFELFNALGRKGFSCNFLTKYSDPDRMLDHLYYADPLFLFDYCKKHFSRNVALLHDYEIYDFTILVRKS
jgi:cyclopropane fatty-acyl-phospholipid synthase-like methyltransferase